MEDRSRDGYQKWAWKAGKAGKAPLQSVVGRSY